MVKEIIAKKAAIVDEVADKFKNSVSNVVVDYRGLTVEEVTDLRKQYVKPELKCALLRTHT